MENENNVQNVKEENVNPQLNQETVNEKKETVSEVPEASQTAKIIGTVIVLIIAALLVFWISKRFLTL